jgi:hypothetical protein
MIDEIDNASRGHCGRAVLRPPRLAHHGEKPLQSVLVLRLGRIWRGLLRRIYIGPHVDTGQAHPVA